MKYEIELNDLMKLCLVLDTIIKARVAEEDQHLDGTIGKPMTRLQAQIMMWGLNDLEELRDLRDRLFNQIPQEHL